MVISMRFAENLRALRLQRCLTQKEIGTLAGITPITISSYESGKSVPNMHQLIAIADALNVSLDELVGYTSEQAPMDVDPLYIELAGLSEQERSEALRYIRYIKQHPLDENPL